MAPRPTEIKAVALLLESPAANAEGLAREIIEKLDALRADRTEWVLITQPVPEFTSVWGRFPTELKASKEWERYTKQMGDVFGSRACIAPLRSAPPDYETDESGITSRIVVSPFEGGARTGLRLVKFVQPAGASVI